MRQTFYALAAILLTACQPIEINKTDENTDKYPATIGQGTYEAPYTVGQVLSGTENTRDVWVAGYVIGYVTQTINNATLSSNKANTSNVIIAGKPDETDPKHMLTVQLGTADVKRGVALSYNPDGLGKAVMLHAKLIATYCYALGLREVDKYLWLPDDNKLDLGYDNAADNQGETDDNKEEDNNHEAKPTPGFRTGTEFINIFNDETNTLPDVRILNDKPSLNIDADILYSLDAVVKNEALMGVYNGNIQWMIGYTKGWNDETSVIVTGYEDRSAEFIAEMPDEEFVQWMQSTLTDDKADKLLRIRGRLKKKRSQYHIIDIESLDWLW